MSLSVFKSHQPFYFSCEYTNTKGDTKAQRPLRRGMFILPYSPRWLVSKGRHEEARAALFRLHGSRESNRLAVEAEFAEIDAQVTWERENLKAKFSDLWASKASLHRTACACLVQICCQFSGVNVNAYYSPLIYQGLGYTGNTVLLVRPIRNARAFSRAEVVFCSIHLHRHQCTRRQSTMLYRPPVKNSRAFHTTTTPIALFRTLTLALPDHSHAAARLLCIIFYPALIMFYPALTFCTWPRYRSA